MRLKLLLILFVSCAWQGAASAQTTLQSWQQARELALKQSPDLKAAGLQQKSDLAQQQNGIAVLLPQVRWISTLDYNYALPTQLIPAEFLGGRPGEYKAVQFGTKYNLTSTIDASMPLLNGSAWWDARIASGQKKLINTQYEQKRWELEQAVAKAYFYSILSRDAVQLSRINLQMADSLLLIAEARSKQDLADPLELNRVRANQIQASNQLAQNELTAARNTDQLKLLLGIPQNQELQLLDSLRAYGTGEVTALKGGEYPILRMYQAQENLAGLTLRRDQLKRVPELSFYGKYAVQGQRNDFSFFSSSAQWFEFGSVGLRLEVPIFAGGMRHNTVQKSKWKQELSRLDYQQQKEKQAKEDRDLYQTLLVNQAQVNKSKEAYDLSLNTLHIGLLRYRQGLASYESYLQLYQEMLTTQQNYFRIISETAVSRMLINLKNQL